MVNDLMMAKNGNRHYRTAAVIVNYNNCRDTRNCLEALSKSLTPALRIVVDNGSTEEGIEDICSTYDAVLIKNKENIGFGRGNNVGLKWAIENTNSEYFFIVNNDAAVKESTIAILENRLDNDPKIGAVVPRIVFSDEPDKIWYGGGEVDWKRGCGRVWGFRQSVNNGGGNAKKVTFASACALLIRRSVLKLTGGFDPRYFMYEEDVDLSLRLTGIGLFIEYVPSAVVFHRVQGSLRKNGCFYPLNSPHNPKLPFYIYHLTCNRLLTMYKHAKGINRLKFTMFFPIYWSLKAAQYLLFGRMNAVKAMLRGYIAYRRLRSASCVDEINGISHAR